MDRFNGLNKLATGPVGETLKAAKIELQTKLAVPDGASAAELLARLEAEHETQGPLAEVDMIRVLAETLPRRQAVWWACLAARDVLGHDVDLSGGCLPAAENWVYHPTAEARRAAFEATKMTTPTDPTLDCARLAVFAGGTFGPDKLDEAPVTPGLFSAMVLNTIYRSLDAIPEGPPAPWVQMHIDRGLDIARGGDGRSVPAPGPTAASLWEKQ